MTTGTASMPVMGDCPVHGRTLHGSLSRMCQECADAEDRLTVQIPERHLPGKTYTQTVAYERRISDTLVISRSTITYWAGSSFSLMYRTRAEDDSPGYRGRFVGHLGYHDRSWLHSDAAVVMALQTAHDEWARSVAPYVDRDERNHTR